MGSEKIAFAGSLKDSRLNCFTRLALLLQYKQFSNFHAKLHRQDQETENDT